MNLNSGTFRLVYENALFTFGKMILLYFTIPLFLLWLFIGYFFTLGEDVVAAISGPAYVIISLFAITGFKNIFPVAIGMGSTRTNLLKTFSMVSLVSVLVTVFFLNIFQWMLLTLYERWNVAANILHPAILFKQEYSFISYFLIDLMFVTFIFSITFLLFTIYYRLGLKKSVIWLMVLLIIGTLLNYSGVVNFSLYSWLTTKDLNVTILFTFITIISLIALLMTYPIMRNAPLQPKSKKD
ncbi:hypothetical protein ACIQ4I_01965 [Rummeliibacillus sp. NPDC094406]|uniref:hypothetical protein n=1 Tax=Rummeliibacillus sp. NPDC094406 TaxID=3364511 RepID=UPI0038144752